jgi:eukaryotic-like serine/threonine-protein kinase
MRVSLRGVRGIVADRSGSVPVSGQAATSDGPDAAEPVPADAVRAQLERLLASAGFRYAGRLSRFLRFVVEQRLAGNASQIKESVLAVEIFDRQPSYDSRVESVVRVEARRLREKLDRYYSAEGQNDPVLISLPKGSYAPVFTPRIVVPSAAAPESAPVRRGHPRQLPVRVVIAAALVLAVAFFLGIRWIGPRETTTSPPLRRLTSDPGLTFEPTLSRDGKLLAYSSDRGGEGNLNIWVQQVAGGTPVRLTNNVDNDVDPEFSPDGALVAYRAEGEMDGVYLVPTLGGKRTLLARGGYRPEFSPDGTAVAYWTGERTWRAAKIFVVPAAGGSAVPFQPGFRYAAFPIWSPDGQHIAFVGIRSQTPREESNSDNWDWWVASVAGGPAVRVGARQVFDQQGLKYPETSWSHSRIVPGCWTRSGYLVFSARLGDQTNIWRLRLSTRDWRVRGPAEQLTFGAGREDHPTIAKDGALAFSVLTRKSDVWSLPIRANTAEVRGPMVRLTAGAATYIRPFVSRDGSRLAVLSNLNGNYDVWVKSLATGRERALTATRQDEISPIVSPDGSKVAYGYAAPLKQAIFIVPFGGGPAAQLCADCGEPRAWLPNGAGLVYQGISSSGESFIGLLSMTGKATTLVRSSASSLFSPSISPDGKWMAVIVRTPPNDHQVTVIPIRGAGAAAQRDWIPVTEAGSWVDKPRWSPDGAWIYYVSNRDGFVCIWAQRLDMAAKKPIGDPKPVVHFHDVRN